MTTDTDRALDTCVCPECGSTSFHYSVLDDCTGEYLNCCEDCGEIFGCGKFISDTDRAEPLTRWERYYLERSRHGVYASFPRNCKHVAGLVAKGYIAGFGFVMGNRCEHRLTQKGVEVWEALHPAPAADGGEAQP